MRWAWLDETQQQAQPLEYGAWTALGVWHEVVDPDEGEAQRVLERLKAERGYLEQDIVELTPETPGLVELCAKFEDEHRHTDDEVRYVLGGEGIFDVRSRDDRWMRLWVERGDLLVVPAELHHRFLLTERRQIRCVRLFKDRGGWVPHYRGS